LREAAGGGDGPQQPCASRGASPEVDRSPSPRGSERAEGSKRGGGGGGGFGGGVGKIFGGGASRGRSVSPRASPEQVGRKVVSVRTPQEAAGGGRGPDGFVSPSPTPKSHHGGGARTPAAKSDVTASEVVELPEGAEYPKEPHARSKPAWKKGMRSISKLLGTPSSSSKHAKHTPKDGP